MNCSRISIVDFEQTNSGGVAAFYRGGKIILKYNNGMALRHSAPVDNFMLKVITKTQAQTCVAEVCLEPCKTTMMRFFCNNSYPAGIYHLKVNKRNIRTRCEICSILTMLT